MCSNTQQMFTESFAERHQGVSFYGHDMLISLSRFKFYEAMTWSVKICGDCSSERVGVLCVWNKSQSKPLWNWWSHYLGCSSIFLLSVYFAIERFICSTFIFFFFSFFSQGSVVSVLRGSLHDVVVTSSWPVLVVLSSFAFFMASLYCLAQMVALIWSVHFLWHLITVFFWFSIFFSLEFVHAIPAMCKFQNSNTKILFSILWFLKDPRWIVNKQACWSQAAGFKSCPSLLSFLVIGKLTILSLSHLQIGLIKDIYLFGFFNSLHDLILYRPSMIPGVKKAFQWGECLFSCI